MRRQTRSYVLKLGGAVLVTLFLLTTWFAQPAIGVTPPQQDGRPTLPPPQPGGPGGGGAEGESSLTQAACTGVRGAVINWGYQNEPGVTLRLSDGGWQTMQITSADGSYQFGGLGEGIAFLSADLSPGQAETLRPMADDVAVRLRCDLEVVANLGLYSSPQRPDPPATVTMTASKQAVLPGQSAVFYLTLKNGMAHAISHVFLTDYLPDGLTVAEVTSSLGSVEVLNGRMVTIYVGELDQGAEATIQISVQADPALAYGTSLKNTATLLYAESAADQAWATLVVGGAAEAAPAPTTPPGSATPTPEAAATPEATPQPADELLPTTGGGGPVAILSAIVVLVLLLAGVRQVRKQPAGE